MKQFSKSLLPISLADGIVRSAYQMGKTPLLPLFAVSLGASDGYVGLIISVSTCTGLLLKPFLGWLSDWGGRRILLYVAVCLFTLVPCLYSWVYSPAQLMGLRMFHGLATGIFGPVSLAYVIEHAGSHRSEHLAWFVLSRKFGYILGPLVAGWMLLSYEPVDVFLLMAMLSSVAFLPLLFLMPSTPRQPVRGSTSFFAKIPKFSDFWSQFLRSHQIPGVWLAASLELLLYVVFYALKAFLPLYGLRLQWEMVWVGLLFALQETCHIVCTPWSGKLGDRYGHVYVLQRGIVLVALLLLVLPYITSATVCLGWAAVLGMGQAMVFPALLAWVSMQLPEDGLATGLGVVGSWRNAGKVIGPILGGMWVALLGYPLTFCLMGCCLLLVAYLVQKLDPFSSLSR